MNKEQIDAMIGEVMDYGPSWLWRTLPRHFPEGYMHTYREKRVDDFSWDKFFKSWAKDQTILLPKDPIWYIPIEEFERLMIPMLEPLNKLWVSDMPTRFKVWALRWGIDQEGKLFGSAFYAFDDMLTEASQSEAVPYSEDVEWLRDDHFFAPKELMWYDFSDYIETPTGVLAKD